MDASLSVTVAPDPPPAVCDVPVEPPSAGLTTREVVEMLLKDRRKLDLFLRHDVAQRRMIPKLSAAAVGGFALYGLTATLLLNLLHRATGYWLPFAPASSWNDFSVGNLTTAYVVGLIAANGICLPSFYFYGLLAGVRITMLGATAHALKGMAAGAVALVGILPAYVPLALAAVIWSDDLVLLQLCAATALALPFISGLWGVVSLYEGFIALADTIPCDRRAGRRCLLRRLVLAWSGCYTFVTPWVIYALWHHLARITS